MKKIKIGKEKKTVYVFNGNELKRKKSFSEKFYTFLGFDYKPNIISVADNKKNRKRIKSNKNILCAMDI